MNAVSPSPEATRLNNLLSNVKPVETPEGFQLEISEHLAKHLVPFLVKDDGIKRPIILRERDVVVKCPKDGWTLGRWKEVLEDFADDLETRIAKGEERLAVIPEWYYAAGRDFELYRNQLS